ncbi:MAG: hypothetical protein RI967_179 [Planctomycetota bacterium]
MNPPATDGQCGFTSPTENTEITERARKQAFPAAIPLAGSPSARLLVPKSLDAVGMNLCRTCPHRGHLLDRRASVPSACSV